MKRILFPLDGTPADPDSPPRPPGAPGLWLDPLPGSWLNAAAPSPDDNLERRETISLAFMIALHKLNACQRVVLILRKVFNWSAKEVAEALGLTVPAINNLL
jgi:RNA polymerase sigma-70 factor (ECF subfamily)